MLTTTLALLLASSEPSEPTPVPVTPSVERRVRWLPRVTLRFTHRGSASWWADSVNESLSTPLGTTFEVRFEWGASPSDTP